MHTNVVHAVAKSNSHCDAQCCLWGYSGEHPPHDDQGYLEFAASLEQKDLYEVSVNPPDTLEPTP